MKKNKRKKLSFKMTIYSIVFIYFISFVIGGFGCYTYYISSDKHYKMYMESVLNITSREIDGDDLEICIGNLTKSSKYKETQLKLDGIKISSKVQYIYIIYPMEETDSIMYVLTAYTNEQRESFGEYTSLGEDSGDDFPENVKIHFYNAMKNGVNIKYVFDKSEEYGDMLTGTLPIINSKGEVVALLAVDISIQDIMLDLIYFAVTILIGIFFMGIVFTLLFSRKINKTVVKPITQLSSYADEFVDRDFGNKKSEEFVFKELSIRSNDEIGLLSEHIQFMMKNLMEYIRDFEIITAEKERIGVELNIAKQIQSSMLPSVFPAFPERTDFDIFATMQPAKEVGGDFYDFFLIDGVHLGIVIADISGKGIPAALFMVRVKTLIKNYAKLGLEPAKVFAETNNQLCEGNGADMSVNVFMGIVDLYNGYFTYANAGNHTPLLRRAGGEFEWLGAKNGFVLAGLEKVIYNQEMIRLAQGDMLFLFTNGVRTVVDWTGVSYADEYLIECLNQAVLRGYELEDVLDWVKNGMNGSGFRHEVEDDVSMMLFRYLGM